MDCLMHSIGRPIQPEYGQMDNKGKSLCGQNLEFDTANKIELGKENM